MKWLFSILIIANLGMFIWLYPQHNGPHSRPLPPDVGELRLVGEPEPEQSEDDPAATPESPATETADVAASPSSPGASETAESPQLPPVIASGDTAPAASAAPTGQTESTPPAAAPVCASVGGFDKRSQAELLSVRLLAQGIKTEITSESSNDQSGYWVLIPPQANRAAAVQVAKDLEAAGVADLWRFTSGSLAHAISLGLFRDEERAVARKDQIAEMGFTPEVRPRYRELTLYWLNYRYTGENPLAESDWQELLRESPQLERRESPCP